MSKIDELTAFEQSIAEKAAGCGIGVLGDPSFPQVGLLGALAWVHVKRGEPTLTYEAYMRRVTADELSDYLFGADEDEEQPSAGFPDADAAVEGAGGDEGADVHGAEDPAV